MASAEYHRKWRAAHPASCRAATAKWRKANPDKVALVLRRSREKRIKSDRLFRVKDRLRRDGIIGKAAEALARWIMNPNTRCYYCGCSNRWLWGKVRQGYWFPGGMHRWQRLTIEHRIPMIRSDPSTIVPACWHCNLYRQHARHSDEEVRCHAVKFWTRLFPGVTFRWLRVRVRLPRPSSSVEKHGEKTKQKKG